MAAIVAIVALACHTLPLLLRSLIQSAHRQLRRRLLYRGRRCDAIAWEDLHDRRLQTIPTPQTILSATSEHGLAVSLPAVESQTLGLAAFFERVWCASAPRDPPRLPRRQQELPPRRR